MVYKWTSEASQIDSRWHFAFLALIDLFKRNFSYFFFEYVIFNGSKFAGFFLAHYFIDIINVLVYVWQSWFILCFWNSILCDNYRFAYLVCQHLYLFAICMCNKLRSLLNYDFPIESIEKQINNEPAIYQMSKGYSN